MCIIKYKMLANWHYLATSFKHLIKCHIMYIIKYNIYIYIYIYPHTFRLWKCNAPKFYSYEYSFIEHQLRHWLNYYVSGSIDWTAIKPLCFWFGWFITHFDRSSQLFTDFILRETQFVSPETKIRNIRI
jgi:hypothetical protein